MQSRFDALAKLLAGGMSRREVLRRLGGTAAGAVLASLGLGCKDDVVGQDDVVGPSRPLFATGRCRVGGRKCRENSECCSGFCDPATGVCACYGTSVECPATGQCISCGGTQVLNPDTCQCVCAPGTTTCTVGGSTTCCPEGTQCCSSGFYPFCADTNSDRSNCGRCGGTCTSTEVCFNGLCCQATNLNQCRFPQ